MEKVFKGDCKGRPKAKLLSSQDFKVVLQGENDPSTNLEVFN